LALVLEKLRKYINSSPAVEIWSGEVIK
jgi:hypothetical protein